MSEQPIWQLETAEWEVEDLFTITQFSTKPCRSSAIAMPATPAVIRCDVIIVCTAGFARSRCQCLWPCLWPRCGLLRDKKGRLLEGRAGFHAGETQGDLSTSSTWGEIGAAPDADVSPICPILGSMEKRKVAACCAAGAAGAAGVAREWIHLLIVTDSEQSCNMRAASSGLRAMAQTWHVTLLFGYGTNKDTRAVRGVESMEAA